MKTEKPKLMNKEDKRMIDKMIEKLKELKEKKLSPYVIDQLQCISGELDETIEMMED